MIDDDFVRQAAVSAGLAPVGVVLDPLDGGTPAVRLDDHAPFYPASMIKTPLAAVAFTLVADGALDLEATCAIEEANMTVNDKASPLVPGYAASMRDLIELMITRSDNVATNVLFDVIGRARATHIAQNRLQLSRTAFHRKLSGSLPLIVDPDWDGVHRNTHPPSDAALLLRMIATGKLPYADELCQVLARQEWNNKLSGGLLPGDRFAHKTGDTDEVTHDGGILRTREGAAYVIVVYTGMESSDEHSARFVRLMTTLRPQL